jgi:branched-chain amino acid transport system permease protein
LFFGLAGLAFNILLGYGGLLSFGHAAYFAVGAYTVAMLYRYLKIENLETLLAAAILTSLAVSAFFGLVATRFTKIFFSIISLALTQVVWATTLKMYWLTGGSDGIRVPHMALLGIEFQKTMNRPEYLASVFYYYALGVFVIAVLVVWLILFTHLLGGPSKPPETTKLGPNSSESQFVDTGGLPSQSQGRLQVWLALSSQS